MSRLCRFCRTRPATSPLGRPVCAECSAHRRRAARRRWYAANREQVSARQARWAEQNRDRVKAYKRRWRLDHPERVRVAARQYRARIAAERPVRARPPPRLCVDCQTRPATRWRGTKTCAECRSARQLAQVIARQERARPRPCRHCGQPVTEKGRKVHAECSKAHHAAQARDAMRQLRADPGYLARERQATRDRMRRIRASRTGSPGNSQSPQAPQ